MAAWGTKGANSVCLPIGSHGTGGAEQKMVQTLPAMTVCGEGELVKTFLTAKQAPAGKEVF
jgi:hypothetical protein